MKVPQILRPVQEWFQAIGAVGKEHHASATDPNAGSKTEEVIRSPAPKKEKSRHKKGE